MLIIITFIIIAIMGAVFHLLSNKFVHTYIFEPLEFCCVLAAICGIVCTALMGTICYYSSYTDYLTLKEEEESLTYKSEAFNNGLADELGLNNNNLLNEIKNYNRDVIELKRNSSSMWIGLYYNPIVNELELIDYSIFNFSETEDELPVKEVLTE